VRAQSSDRCGGLSRPRRAGRSPDRWAGVHLVVCLGSGAATSSPKPTSRPFILGPPRGVQGGERLYGSEIEASTIARTSVWNPHDARAFAAILTERAEFHDWRRDSRRGATRHRNRPCTQIRFRVSSEPAQRRERSRANADVVRGPCWRGGGSSARRDPTEPSVRPGSVA
jgi:hypothetical protein